MRALESLQQYIGEFQIEAAIPSECGFIDEFLIKSINLNDIGMPKNLFITFISHYFTKKFSHSTCFSKFICNFAIANAKKAH